jgi:hypothetical protein
MSDPLPLVCAFDHFLIRALHFLYIAVFGYWHYHYEPQIQLPISCTQLFFYIEWMVISFNSCKKRGGFPECLGSGTRGRGFVIKKRPSVFPECLGQALAEEFF